MAYYKITVDQTVRQQHIGYVEAASAEEALWLYREGEVATTIIDDEIEAEGDPKVEGCGDPEVFTVSGLVTSRVAVGPGDGPEAATEAWFARLNGGGVTSEVTNRECVEN